jgi:Ca2+-binding RTX toxin-like protein
MAAPAHASVAFLDEEGSPEAHGSPGEANDMTALAGGDGVIFTDAAGIAPQAPDNGCRSLSPTEVTCLSEGGGELHGEDGNDTLRDAGVTLGFHARGGPGNDMIVAGGVPAILYGDDSRVRSSDGDDRIVGSNAATPLRSPEFHDFINGGGGDDTIDAGAGSDHASGQTGSDVVDGGAGDDFLDSTSLVGPGGNDQLVRGDAGDDRLTGGDGNDQLDAIKGRDQADGGAGNDLLRAVDGDLAQDDNSVDGLTCGSGGDRVLAGSGDRVLVGCEKLLVPMYCSPRYPCKVTGTVAGRKPGTKRPRIVARVARTINSPTHVAFALGSKATNLLGSAKRVGLSTDVIARRGGRVAGGRNFRFQLVRAAGA